MFPKIFKNRRLQVLSARRARESYRNIHGETIPPIHVTEEALWAICKGWESPEIWQDSKWHVYLFCPHGEFMVLSDGLVGLDQALFRGFKKALGVSHR